MVPLTTKYQRLAVKRCYLHIDIWFINRCLCEGLTPTFAKIKVSRNCPFKMQKELQIKLLLNERRKKYCFLDNINTDLKMTYDILLDNYPFFYIQEILQSIFCNVNVIRDAKYKNIVKKLKNLRELKIRNQEKISNNKITNSFPFHNRTINLSNTVFNNVEVSMLDKGLKYSVSPILSEKKIAEFSIDIDILIDKCTEDVGIKRILKNKSTSILQKQILSCKKVKKKNTDISLINNIKKKITSNDLILSKADKGNCIIIMEKTDYINKVESFLYDNDFSQGTALRWNNLYSKIRIVLKKCNCTISKYTALNLLISNPYYPRLYGLPKIHKLNVPIRPVVSFFNTPVEKIAKFVLNLLTNLTNFKPTHTIKNSLELVEDLANTTVGNCLLISLDVVNLFTSVPRDESISLVKELLIDKVTPRERKDIVDLLKLCLDQDFFIFNQTIYIQNTGLAMGNPLSPFLADLFLHNFETTHIIPKFDKIKYYKRYVDDCFLLFNGSTSEVQNMLNSINNINSNINFTIEIEVNNRINYLDLWIGKNGDNSFSFDIYRKSTQTDHVIPANSCHSLSHKMAGFHSLLNRLLNIPMTADGILKELNTIKYLAMKNDYHPDLVDKMLCKKQSILRRNFAYSGLVNEPSKKFFSIPYIGDISQKISKIFNNDFELKVKVVFKSFNKLSDLLVNSKDLIPFYKKSGIYKIWCNTCNVSYFGRTCRSLELRSREHLLRADSSAFGHHILFNKHKFHLKDNAKLIHYVIGNRYNLKLDLLEDLEIYIELKNNRDMCLNTQTLLNLERDPIFKNII